jgi:aryl-alcohol dehydrogenase-like predicted oxidoreductase
MVWLALDKAPDPPKGSEDGRGKTNPRFTGENFHRNLAIVDEVRAIGAEVGASQAQTALAWLLTPGIRQRA